MNVLSRSAQPPDLESLRTVTFGGVKRRERSDWRRSEPRVIMMFTTVVRNVLNIQIYIGRDFAYLRTRRRCD